MEPLVEGVGQTLGEQLRAVHQLTVALHRAETAAHFYEEAIDTILAARHAGTLTKDRG